MKHRRCVLFVVIALGTSAWAQETAAEKLAARDVLHKMDVLEQSLQLESLLHEMTAPSAERERVVGRARELMNTEMLALGDAITRDPEVGFKEDRAVRKQMQDLEKHGFETEDPAWESFSSMTLCAAPKGRFMGTSTAPRAQSA